MKFPECFRERCRSRIAFVRALGRPPPYWRRTLAARPSPAWPEAADLDPFSGYGRSDDANDPPELTVQIRSPGHNDFWSKPEYASTLFLCLV